MQVLTKYKNDLTLELNSILQFWIDNSIDDQNGGFVGKIDNNNVIDLQSPKGSVLNARILWSFSAAFNLTKNDKYLEYAEKAFKYIINHFIDKEFGGVYWTLDYKGRPLDTKKQVYAIAFTIYALSEYYEASRNEASKNLSISLYNLIIEKSFDKYQTGYFEAFTKEWKELGDLRLSDKDANEKKTMNTHLHVLESFTNLYKIWPDDSLKKHIHLVIENFIDHMICDNTSHLILFLDENWNQKSGIISYGHDIEASWLILEAAEIIQNEELIIKTKDIAIKLAIASLEGLDNDGSLFYEFQHRLVKEKHWWVQAEAMIGFFNVWQVNGNTRFLNHSLKCWEFVKNSILDAKYGEWFWGIGEDNKVMKFEDKAGLWKCPYHNSRACIEIIKRIDIIENII